MRITQSIATFDAYRALSATDAALDSTSDELLPAGGFDGAAAPDVAGLTTPKRRHPETWALRQAIRQAQAAISFVQTAKGAMIEVDSMLQRMRALAVDAANGTTIVGPTQQAEIAELLTGIDSIGANTTFAGNRVFSDYSAPDSGLTFHVGVGSPEQIRITADLSIGRAGVVGVDVSIADGRVDAYVAVATIDKAIESISAERAALCATQDRFEYIAANLAVAIENLHASELRPRNVDMAQEIVNITRTQIMTQPGTAMAAQAKQVTATALSLLQ